MTASAAAVGFDVARLERMTEAIAKGEEYPNVHAVLIVKDGRLVYEEYFKGEDRRWRDGALRSVELQFDRDTLHDVRSVGKSVTSALAGIALASGALPSLDTPLIRLFPEHAARATEAARRVTLRHALTMSAGFDWNEQAVPYTDSTNHSERMAASADPVGFLLGRPAAADTGSVWAYNSGLPAWVGLAIARGTRTPLGRYAGDVLFEPLGVTRAEWTGPPAWRNLPELRWEGSPGWGDVANPAGSLWLRPRDLAKFGVLYLDRGRWQGRQVIPAEWVRESTRRHIAIRDSTSDYGEHGYGYLWWHDRYKTPEGELEVHTAVGNGAQRVFVVPSLRMLVVHLAGRYNDPDADWMPERLLLKHILPAMESGPALAQAEDSPMAGAELASRIDSLLAELEHADAPGCAVGVDREKELVFATKHGSRTCARESTAIPAQSSSRAGPARMDRGRAAQSRGETFVRVLEVAGWVAADQGDASDGPSRGR